MDRSVGSPRTQSVVGVRGPGVSVFGLPPGGMLMPNPGTDNMSKCSAVARGGGEGGWAPLELIDALISLIPSR